MDIPYYNIIPLNSKLNRVRITKRNCQLQKKCEPTQLREESDFYSFEEQSVLFVKRASIVYTKENVVKHFMQFGNVIDASLRKISNISLQGYVVFDKQTALLNALSSHIPSGMVLSRTA